MLKKTKAPKAPDSGQVSAKVLVTGVLNRNDHERAFAESDAGRLALSAVEQSLETGKPIDEEMADFIRKQPGGAGAATALVEAASSIRRVEKQKQPLIEHNRAVKKRTEAQYNKYRGLARTLRAENPKMTTSRVAGEVAKRFGIDPRTVYRALKTVD